MLPSVPLESDAGSGSARANEKQIPSISPRSFVRRNSATRAPPPLLVPRRAEQQDSPSKMQDTYAQQNGCVGTDEDQPRLKRSRSMPFESSSPTNSASESMNHPPTVKVLGVVGTNSSLNSIHAAVRPQGLFKSPSPLQNEDKLGKTAYIKRQEWAQSQLIVGGRSRTGSEVQNPNDQKDKEDAAVSTPPSRAQLMRGEDNIQALNLDEASHSLDLGVRLSRTSMRVPGTPVSRSHASRRPSPRVEQLQVYYDAEEPLNELAYQQMFSGHASKFNNSEYQTTQMQSSEFSRNTLRNALYTCECGHGYSSNWFLPPEDQQKRLDMELRGFLGAPPESGLLRSAFQQKQASLGEGAFGSVYKAVRESDGKAFAVKELKPTHDVNVRSLRRQAHAQKVLQPIVTRDGKVLTFVDIKQLREERQRRGVCSCGRTGLVAEENKWRPREESLVSIPSSGGGGSGQCVPTPSQLPAAFQLTTDHEQNSVRLSLHHRGGSISGRVRESAKNERSRSHHRRTGSPVARYHSPLTDGCPGSQCTFPDSGLTPLMKSTHLTETCPQTSVARGLDRDLLWLGSEQVESRGTQSLLHELHFLRDGADADNSSMLHIPVHTDVLPEGRSLAETAKQVGALADSGLLELPADAYTQPLSAFLKTLVHPHLLRHYSLWVENNDTVYLATSLCDGDQLTLGDNLRKAKDFSEKHIWSIIKQTMRAQTYLHRIGFVHRDIKPQNVLFTNEARAVDQDSHFVELPRCENAEYRLVLADFGSVEPVDKNQASDNSEEVDGNYIAPEVLNVAEVAPGFVERVLAEDLAYRILEREELDSQGDMLMAHSDWNPIDAAQRVSSAPSHSVIALEYHGRSQKQFSPQFSQNVNLQDSFFKPDNDDANSVGLFDDTSSFLVQEQAMDNISVGSLSNTASHVDNHDDECQTPPTKKLALSSGRQTPIHALLLTPKGMNVHANNNSNNNSYINNNSTDAPTTPPATHSASSTNHSYSNVFSTPPATNNAQCCTPNAHDQSVMLNKTSMSFMHDSAYLRRSANKKNTLSKADVAEQLNDILSFYQTKNEESKHGLDLCDVSPVKSVVPTLRISQGPWSDVFSMAMTVLVLLNGGLHPSLRVQHQADRSWRSTPLPLNPLPFQRHSVLHWTQAFYSVQIRLLPDQPTDASAYDYPALTNNIVPGVSNELVSLLQLLLEPNPQQRISSTSVLTICKYLQAR